MSGVKASRGASAANDMIMTASIERAAAARTWLLSFCINDKTPMASYFDAQKGSGRGSYGRTQSIREPKTAHRWESGMYRVAVFACIILAFGVATSRAGPCTSDILSIEKAVNEPNSPYAPTARQSVGAQLSRQPTPSSVARAEGQADSTY